MLKVGFGEGEVALHLGGFAEVKEGAGGVVVIVEGGGGFVGVFEVGFDGGVLAAREQVGGEGAGDGDEGGLLPGGVGDVEGGEDGGAFEFELLVVFFVGFDVGGHVGEQALLGGGEVGGTQLEVVAGVVGDDLVELVAVAGGDFEQAGLAEVVEFFVGAVCHGQGGLLGEGLGFGGEDGEGVEGRAGWFVEQLVGYRDDGLQ